MSSILYPPLPLLLVDDEAAWLRSFSLTLKSSAGLTHLMLCNDSRKVLDILAQQEVGVVLLDLNMPHLSGEDLLAEIVIQYPDIPVIIISGMNQVETAVHCVRQGAFDYFVKGVEVDRLIAGIHRALKLQKLSREHLAAAQRLLEDGPKDPGAFAGIVTRSPKMLRIFKYVEAIAGDTGPVLITGESGTGKELIARVLHRLGRPSGSWQTLNVAGLDEAELNLLLFGDEARGGGRPGLLEKARGGTLLLDEIGEIPLGCQGRLLRLAQGGEWAGGLDTPGDKPPARLLFATSCNLEEKVAAGSFRRDFYYRLRQNHLPLPPLRERLEDLPLLLEHFLAEAAESQGKRKPTPPPELVTLLETHYFPGNVRELRTMVQRAVIAHRSHKLSMEVFKNEIAQGTPADGEASGPEGASLPKVIFPGPLPTLSESADLLVDEALERAKGNQSIAANLLGITRQALNQRLRKRG